MTDIGFAPKEVISQEVCRLEVLYADKAEAYLGRDFHKRPGVSLESLVGKQFVAQVTQTRTGSRNKVEFGTIGPVPPEEKDSTPESKGSDDEDMFSDLP